MKNKKNNSIKEQHLHNEQYLESVEDLKIYMLNLNLSEEQEKHILSLAHIMVNSAVNVALHLVKIKEGEGDKHKFIDVLIEFNNLK